MAGTIVADVIQSDQSYPSSINIASPMIVSNTISMGSSAAISGNVNFDSNLLFVDAVNNKVGIKTQNPSGELDARIGDVRFGDGTANVSVRLTGPNNWDFFKDNSSDVLSIRRNSVSRFNINGSGYVTMPYQPAFHVRVNDSNYITTSPIPFSNEVFDVGGNFNTGTYRFTAPIAGKYYMAANFYLRVDGGGQDAYPRYRLNGTTVQYVYVQKVDASRMDVTLSMNRIFDLAAGDYVDVIFQGSGYYYGGSAETNWYGWLIA